MTVIKQEDFIQSIADAFQFISYYHPVDYIKALSKAQKGSIFQLVTPKSINL